MLRLLLALLLSAVPHFAMSATMYGPSPYLQVSDSPFAGTSFGWFYLEDFEDGVLNTPGVSALNNKPGGSALGAVAPGVNTDSVDNDDGVIDGLGRDGHSFGPTGNDGTGGFGVTFSFDELVLGMLPTHVGIVWTDGNTGGSTIFEAFDVNDNSIGIINSGPFHDGSFQGQTAEDRFFGVEHLLGIKSFVIRDPGSNASWEVDHLQYGAVPIPEPPGYFLLILGGLGWLLFRRQKPTAV